jgi:hypothetical protein
MAPIMTATLSLRRPMAATIVERTTMVTNTHDRRAVSSTSA